MDPFSELFYASLLEGKALVCIQYFILPPKKVVYYSIQFTEKGPLARGYSKVIGGNSGWGLTPILRLLSLVVSALSNPTPANLQRQD